MPDGSHFDVELPARAAARSRPPVLGRFSVFVIGIVLGVAIGAVAAILVWPMVSQPPQAAAPVAKAAETKATVAAPPPIQPIRMVAGRPLTIGVFGDSLGDGMWAGLYRQLKDDKGFRVVRYSKAATGLTSYQYVNVHDAAADALGDQQIDVAVVMIGANDEQGIATAGQVYKFGTPAWLSVYQQRIDDMVALLKAHGAAVYWVGLPKMRRVGYDERAQFLNSLYEGRARALGVTFVPTVPVTINADGRYDDYLADGPKGRPRLMRAEDGIHMTMAGYLRLAGPVLGAIRADAARTPTAAAGGRVSQVASVQVSSTSMSSTSMSGTSEPGAQASGAGAATQ